MPISDDMENLRGRPQHEADRVDEVQAWLRRLAGAGAALTEAERRALLAAANAAEHLRICLHGLVNQLTVARLDAIEAALPQPADRPHTIAVDGGGALHRRDLGLR